MALVDIIAYTLVLTFSFFGSPYLLDSTVAGIDSQQFPGYRTEADCKADSKRIGPEMVRSYTKMINKRDIEVKYDFICVSHRESNIGF